MHDLSSTTSPNTTVSSRSPVDLDTVFTVRNTTDAVISPDGKLTAFVLSEWLEDQPKQRSRIWLIETTGGDPRPLTQGPRADTSPTWSPDSQSLAFLSRGEESDAKAQLFLITIQGGETKQVCTVPNGVSDITWSPDGSRIAFLAFSGSEPESDPLVLRPDAEQHRRLWTIRPESDTPEPVTPDGFTIWNYAWTPDSHQFAVYYVDTPGETGWFRGQIGLVAASGGAIRQLSQLTRQACGLTWSPDGTRLAYLSGEWSDPDRGGGDIYTLSIANGQTRNLTPGIDWSPSWCHWFPDGQHLLCAGWRGVSCQVGALHEETGRMTLLTTDFVLGNRPWCHLSTTPDMRTVVATHSEQHPYDVWSGKLTRNDESEYTLTWRRLSRLNPLAEETLTLAPGERLLYPGNDGRMIEALVTWPLQTGRTPPPLIVNVHGGPSSLWVDDWDSYRSQGLAAAGFAVLRANIRGSMGGGVDFADAVLGDMGGNDLQDLLRGIDELVARKLVDGDRVGIMGWSYGGFMAAWAVTQTTRFKAAIMGAGVSDFHSFHAQTNIPDWDMRFLASEGPISSLTHAEVYRARSPITHARHVSTPTLIVHGAEDPCVPINQAYAFYRALKELHIPTELVVYPREGHGLLERKHLHDYHQRLLDWFKHYLS